MSVELFPEASGEQRMLADSATRVLEAAYPLTAVRERAEGAGPPDGKLWRALGGLGCFGLLASEEHGGGSLSGNGVADAAILAAERGARLAPGPFVATLVVAGTLSRSGAVPPARGAPGHDGVLQALLSGDTAAAWASDAPPGSPPGPGLAVRDSGGEAVLSGVIHGVQDAADCGWILVSTDGSQFLLPSTAAGLTLRKADGLDLTRKFYTLTLEEVRVPAGATVAPASSGPALADWQLAVVAVLSAAESVGAMDANFKLALDYSKTRIAFGRPIGSFQGLKHLLARTSLALEMAKAIVAGAAEALGGGAPDGPALASAARAFVSENAVELTHNCFQVFGGIGFTWEHDQHLYMRRLASEAYLFGSPSWHRRRIWEAAHA
jgi:alkylation response protein AidB-like acyl-CoA dehydrogenase